MSKRVSWDDDIIKPFRKGSDGLKIGGVFLLSNDTNKRSRTTRNDLSPVFDPLSSIENMSLTSSSRDEDVQSNDDLFSDPSCFVDIWEDDLSVRGTIHYEEIVHKMFDMSSTFETITDVTSDGQTIFITKNERNGRSYIFKQDNGSKVVGTGAYGEIRSLLFLDSDDWSIDQDSRNVVLYSSNWVDVGLVTKFIGNKKEANRERDKIKSYLAESSVCCTVHERHFYGNYFIMRRVDGDLQKFFKDYTARLTNKPDDPYFMQRFTLSMIDRLRRMYLCIYDHGYRYFDIKMGNIGYRIVKNNDENRTKIELIILDIGSLQRENYDINEMNSVYTFKPPEWSKRMYDVRRLTSIRMNRGDYGLEDISSGIGNMIKKTYVWFMGLLLVDMFSYHDEYKGGVDVFFSGTTADYGCYKNNGNINNCAIIQFIQEIFPPDEFPLIYTSLMPYPELRQLTLDESWVS